jgi:hypothetical protein
MSSDSTSSPSRLVKFVLCNAGYLAVVWIGFYEGVAPVAWLASAFVWFMVAIYASIWVDRSACARSIALSSPAPEWLGNLFDVSVGAALLAAQAWWTAGAWVASALIERAIRWRGRAALDSMLRANDS